MKEQKINLPWVAQYISEAIERLERIDEKLYQLYGNEGKPDVEMREIKNLKLAQKFIESII